MEDFGWQALGVGMGEIHLIVFVPCVRGDGKLVDAGLADGADQVPRVETMRHKIIGQPRQKHQGWRQDCRLDIIERLDKPHPHQITPDAVDITFGEIFVVRAGHPGGQFVATRRITFL